MPDLQAINRHVGANIRAIRLLCGMTQQQLAATIGVTFQQIQKYESGETRITAALLYHLSQIFGTNLERFFVLQGENADGYSSSNPAEKHDILDTLDYKTLRICQKISSMQNQDTRKKLHDIINIMCS